MTAEIVLKKHNEHLATIHPGQPFSLTDAHSVGDGVWQGDLGIEIVSGVPLGYELVANPTDADRQLVPLDGSPGSHHRVRSLDGVELYRPVDWGKRADDLRGPCVRFLSANEIVHEPGTDKPHGTVRIESPMTVLCRYQRHMTEEMRANRARD